jgi:hypothetical protein
MAQAYVEIPLSGEKAAGRVALIDIDDYELVSPHTWDVSEVERPAGRKSGPYAATSVRGDRPRARRAIMMHQMITGSRGADHRNHDGLDNRIANLRLPRGPQNDHNRRVKLTSGSGLKGVYYDKRKTQPWQAYITVAGKRQHLGYFAEKEAAGAAYDDAARQHFGEFACLNYPQASGIS